MTNTPGKLRPPTVPPEPSNQSSQVGHKRITDRRTIDPHNVPITWVEMVGSYAVRQGIAGMTLVAAQYTPTEAGIAPDVVVASRLRFSIAFAIELRDTLDKMILAATKTEGHAN
jgi:hypothetical protein